MKESNRYNDATKDASLLFADPPANVDQTFRRIAATVKERTRVACPPGKPMYGLSELTELLANTFTPDAMKKRSEDEEATAASLPRRALDTLQHRLGHATTAWKIAEARINQLEQENAKLLAIIEAQNKIIAEQAATIRSTLRPGCDFYRAISRRSGVRTKNWSGARLQRRYRKSRRS